MAWAGGRAVPTAGPAVRQSPFRALPRGRRQPLSTAPGLSALWWLFAFGEAPPGWGLGRPGRRSLGTRRALNGHLQQLRASGEAETQGGRGRPAVGLPSLDPSGGCLQTARRLGLWDLLQAIPSPAPTPQLGWVPRAEEGSEACPRPHWSRSFSLSPPLRCQRFERGSSRPTAQVEEGWEGSCHCSIFHNLLAQERSLARG